MPLLQSERFTIDYLDIGTGPTVVLIHGAASNNKQWRQLIEDYKRQYRFLAVNLFGYGETTPWPGGATQTMADQVELITSLCDIVEEPVCLAGHSFGGAVAAYSAMSLREKAKGLVLLEANPFPLLAVETNNNTYEEVLALRDFISMHGNSGEWGKVGQRFVDYWLGDGTWMTLPDDRQQAFILALPNNLHEWNTIMNIDTNEELWHDIQAKTLLLRATETKQPIKSIYKILSKMRPEWDYQEISEGGHMAPVTRPDLVNPVMMNFIQSVF